MIKYNYFTNTILILSIIIGVFLRIYNINYDDLWLDEMATFWVTDPNISINEMFERHSSTELAPQFYYLIIYFLHKLFGYDPYIARYFSAFVGIASIFSVGYLTRQVKKNDSFKLSIFLVSLNVFLIIYSMEMRVYMLIFFLSSISLISIIKYLNEIDSNESIYLLFLFFLIQSIAAYSHPFSIIVYISIVCFSLYQYFVSKKNYKKLNICLLITFISIILITSFYYYNLKITEDYLWNTQPSIKFYTNFYFSKFFGSRLLGLIHLIILLFLIFYFRRRIFKQNPPLMILFILLLLSYILPLVYGVYKPIISAKYIIFVLVPIIILISVLVYELKNNLIKKIFISILLILTFFNQFKEENFKQLLGERNYFKPQYKLALSYINSSQNKNYQIDTNFAKTKNLKKYYEIIYINYLDNISRNQNFNLSSVTKKQIIENQKNQTWVLCSYLVNGDICFNLEDNLDDSPTVLDEKIFKNLVIKLIDYN